MTMGNVLKYIALMNLLLATAVHFAAYMPGAAVPIAYALPLFLLIFPLFFAMIIALNSAFPRPVKRPGEGTFAYWQRLRELQTAQWRHLLTNVPWKIKTAFVACAIYVFVNFFAIAVISEGGIPEMQGTGYALVSHGKLIRNLSAAEYQQFRCYSTRLFTGHVILFSLIVWVYFQYVHPQTRLLAGFTETTDRHDIVSQKAESTGKLTHPARHGL